MNFPPGFDLAGFIEHEMHCAAIHEASHVVLLHAFGGHAKGSVWRNDNGGPDQYFWGGRCIVFREPQCANTLVAGYEPVVFEEKGSGEMEVTALPVIVAPPNWRVLVGMAGFVGEKIYLGIREWTDIAGSLQDAIELGDLSATDDALIGDDFSFEAVHEVFDLLNASWAQVELEAEHMIPAADDSTAAGDR